MPQPCGSQASTRLESFSWLVLKTRTATAFIGARFAASCFITQYVHDMRFSVYYVELAVGREGCLVPLSPVVFQNLIVVHCGVSESLDMCAQACAETSHGSSSVDGDAARLRARVRVRPSRSSFATAVKQT
jgi:hypothetical protein